MKILEKNQFEVASNIVRNGGLIAFPTETVFGLGVIYNDKEAYDRLVRVKRRPPEKPFTLMCGKVDDIDRFAIVSPVARKLINKFMPGQFTIILKAKPGLPSWVVSKEGNVGIRVSSDELVSNLIIKAGEPLLVPSANKSGEPPLTIDRDVIDVFSSEVDAIIKGESTSNVPSTIVLVDDSLHIIRLGLITEEDIAKAIKE
jgi:L-threonylcarbamoyladenylate synthase